MATFSVTGKVLATAGYPNVHLGDIWTLTIVTDGFVGVCTVANGHLISVTGSVLIGSYNLPFSTGYPASPTFDSTSNALIGETFGLTSITGFITGTFDYNAAVWSAVDEDAGASGSVGVMKRCLL